MDLLKASPLSADMLDRAIHERLAQDTWEKAAVAARDAVNHVYEYIGQPMLDLGSLMLGMSTAPVAPAQQNAKESAFAEKFGQRAGLSKNFQEQVERRLTPIEIARLNDSQVALLDRGFNADANVFDDANPDQDDLEDAVYLTDDELALKDVPQDEDKEPPSFAARNPKKRKDEEEPYATRILAERACGISCLGMK